jgi:hypothetical protein
VSCAQPPANAANAASSTRRRQITDIRNIVMPELCHGLYALERLAASSAPDTRTRPRDPNASPRPRTATLSPT